MVIDGKSISESVSETQSNAAGLTDMPLSLETKSLETGAALPANASYDRGSELSLGGRVGVAVGASVGTFLIVGLMFAGCNMFYGEINEPVSNAGVRANTLEHPPADVELSPSKPALEAVGGKGKGKAEQIPGKLPAVLEPEDDDPDKIEVAPRKSEEASLSSCSARQAAEARRPISFVATRTSLDAIGSRLLVSPWKKLYQLCDWCRVYICHTAKISYTIYFNSRIVYAKQHLLAKYCKTIVEHINDNLRCGSRHYRCWIPNKV